MDGDPPRLTVGRREHHRFLAEHEHGGTAEKMCGNDCSARRQRTGAIDDGDGIAASVGHRCCAHHPPGGGVLAEGERGEAVGGMPPPGFGLTSLQGVE